MPTYSGIKCASRSPEISCDLDMNLHFLSFDLITEHPSDWWVMGNSSRDVPNIIGNKMWGALQYYRPLHRLLISVSRADCCCRYTRRRNSCQVTAPSGDKGLCWRGERTHVVTEGWCSNSSLKGHGALSSKNVHTHGNLHRSCDQTPTCHWSKATGDFFKKGGENTI